MRHEDFERQMLFNTTPETKRAQREKIEREVAEFLSSGKSVKELPSEQAPRFSGRGRT